jgi:predicted SAM-dependent methyltransferase
MISRQLKAAYYFLCGIPMRVNGMLYRRLRSPSSGIVKVHLGPGQQKYLSGWINVDANLLTAHPDVWANLTDPLPFRDNSVDVFYSHHVIEHLPEAHLPVHCREMFRCLKPGGFIRIGGPNGDNAMKKFVEGDSAWFSDFPESRKSMGGRLSNFILCSGEHLSILTFSYLTELLTAAGFAQIQQCRPTSETRHPNLIDAALLSQEWEDTPDVPHTLLVEAEKPS